MPKRDAAGQGKIGCIFHKNMCMNPSSDVIRHQYDETAVEDNCIYNAAIQRVF